MQGSSAKSLFIARQSLEQFFLRNPSVWFITFTQPGCPLGAPLWTKDQAEERFKPFRDLCSRKGIELLVVWEKQQRGAWHPHCLVNRRFGVEWLRPWMVSRGWGPQMRLEFVGLNKRNYAGLDSPGFYHVAGDGARLVRYLVKYLTKGRYQVDDVQKKKVFGGCQRCKAGVTRFSWTPEVKPGAYLYSFGRDFFSALYGRPPSFRDVGHVIRLGVEVSDWARVDPLWDFTMPCGPPV